MKNSAIITGLLGFGALALVPLACRAGWLHPAFQGEFCAHNHKYVVENSGQIDIQTLDSQAVYYSGTLGGLKKAWTTDISFTDVTNLDNVIGDLQKLSKSVHEADKDEKSHDAGCTPRCGEGSN